MAPKRKTRGTMAEQIADKFGGFAPLARAIGIDPSAVRHWQTDRGGRIPDRWHAPIAKAAKARKIRIKPADFISL